MVCRKHVWFAIVERIIDKRARAKTTAPRNQHDSTVALLGPRQAIIAIDIHIATS